MSRQHDGRDRSPVVAGRRSVLASDADRDATARTLGIGFAEGRLSGDEHEERIRAAYTARTWQELDALTADLPGAADRAAPARSARAAPDPQPLWPVDKCVICVLLIACPPAGIIWLLATRGRSRAPRPAAFAAPEQAEAHPRDRRPGSAAARDLGGVAPDISLSEPRTGCCWGRR